MPLLDFPFSTKDDLGGQVCLQTFGGGDGSPVLGFPRAFLSGRCWSCLGLWAAFPFPPTWWESPWGGHIPWETLSSLQPGPSQIGLPSNSNLLGLQQGSGEGLFKALLFSVEYRK